MRAVAIAVLVLALLPAAAAAKTGLLLTSTPDGLAAGQTWHAEFAAIRNDKPVRPSAGSHPAVVVRRAEGGRSLTFPARNLGYGRWEARVVFPRAGRWTYHIRGFGPRYNHQFWEPVSIPASPPPADPAPVKTTAAGDAFPYGWVGGGAALALLAGGALVLRMRRSV